MIDLSLGISLKSFKFQKVVFLHRNLHKESALAYELAAGSGQLPEYHLAESHLPETLFARNVICPKRRLPEMPFARNAICPKCRLPEMPFARNASCPKRHLPESPKARKPLPRTAIFPKRHLPESYLPESPFARKPFTRKPFARIAKSPKAITPTLPVPKRRG